jgi:hypothetical protein
MATRVRGGLRCLAKRGRMLAKPKGLGLFICKET